MKKFITTILLLICLIGVCYSSYMIFKWYSNNKKNSEIKEKVRSYVVGDDVNFSALKEINPETVAYLEIDGVNIQYTVVKGSDNSYYLNHNFYKEYNSAGWIFMDYRNKFDDSDKNTIIYGHNMLDGSMFGALTKFLDFDFVKNDDNLNIKLISETGVLNYKVFSVYQIEPEDYYLNTEFTDNSFEEFIDNLKTRSKFNFNTEISSLDSILTLSTCSFSGTMRVVLHAKKVV